MIYFGFEMDQKVMENMKIVKSEKSHFWAKDDQNGGLKFKLDKN